MTADRSALLEGPFCWLKPAPGSDRSRGTKAPLFHIEFQDSSAPVKLRRIQNLASVVD